ncbi:MAG: hypothetical protein JSR80_03860 [Verrucomicrobia bacterium]|nr:hypothetical protein [Verrucomicrobiota bacterium]
MALFLKKLIKLNMTKPLFIKSTVLTGVVSYVAAAVYLKPTKNSNNPVTKRIAGYKFQKDETTLDLSNIGSGAP